MSSYFDAIDQRIAAVPLNGYSADHLQPPWKALSSESLDGFGDTEITAAACFDGIHVLATWNRAPVADASWTVTAIDDESCELRTVHVVEGEPVPPMPPYLYQDTADALGKIEEELVRDCTVCAMSEGFPLDLREAIHKVVLKYGVSMLPTNAYPADFDTVEDHKRRLHYLSGDLHTLFHEAAHRGLGDSPLNPIRRLYAQGDEARERMVLQMPAWVCPDEACGRAWGVDWKGAPCPCPRCGKPGVLQAGKTFAQLRTERGYDIPCWECPNGHEQWASTVAGLTCPTCGTVGIASGYTAGQAKESGLNCLVRET